MGKIEGELVNLQKNIDRIIDKVFLGFIPHSVKPNQVTVIRIILTPIVYLLLVNDYLLAGFILFIIAASTDFIDGAMARTRNQITDLGKIIDPVADKMLILVALIFIGFNYLIVKIFIIFMIIEIIGLIFGAFIPALRKTDRPSSSNFFGKVKMILQSISIILFIFGVIISSSLIIGLAEIILIIAFPFAVMSAILMTSKKISQKVVEKT